ncbi:MAG: hypothetical protein QOI98_1485 [Solirubrobacteraceae bacterium]|nr:hypothetical protein [Solirubrobacteraceae bacterium]
MRRLFQLKSPWVLVCACLGGALAGAGGATATVLITGAQIKDSSITGRDIKNKSLTRADFRGLARGPRGLPGATGAAGLTGPPGPTVSAYALVGDPGEAFGETHPTVVGAQTRGFHGPDSITRISTGIYCLIADAGISSLDRVAVATVDASRTNEGIANGATAIVDSNPGATTDGRCPEGAFKVRTYAAAPSGGRVLSNSVAFTIIVP